MARKLWWNAQEAAAELRVSHEQISYWIQASPFLRRSVRRRTRHCWVILPKHLEVLRRIAEARRAGVPLPNIIATITTERRSMRAPPHPTTTTDTQEEAS